MNDEAFIRLLSKLVSFETTLGNPGEMTKCFNYINSELDFFPFTKRQFIQNGVESRVWSTSKSDKTEYILNAHIDVVPGDKSMFKLRKSGDKIFGRGVSDMKYSIALYILALKEIYRKSRKLPSVAIILTSDEETGGYNGVNFLIEKGFRSDIALVPDGGENNCIVENAKGVIHLDIISTGKDAHGARLWEGKDSIEPLSKVIVALRKKYPFPSKKIWKTTINLGKFIAGIQTNQVASKALASIDVRYIPTEKPKEIIKSISKLTRGCYLKEDIHGVAFAIDRNNRFIKKWSKLLGARFINEDIASDGRYFVAKGIPTIVSKPIGGLIHNPGEWTSVKSCLNFGSVLEKFLTSSTK